MIFFNLIDFVDKVLYIRYKIFMPFLKKSKILQSELFELQKSPIKGISGVLAMGKEGLSKALLFPLLTQSHRVTR